MPLLARSISNQSSIVKELKKKLQVRPHWHFEQEELGCLRVEVIDVVDLGMLSFD